MLTLDLKSRFRNKAFIISFVGAIVLLIQQLGFKPVIPSNYADIVNSILSILVMLGIVVDTSTPGISDQTVQAINSATDNNITTKVEATTTAINNTVTENSQATDNLNASSKITVDIPVEE